MTRQRCGTAGQPRHCQRRELRNVPCMGAQRTTREQRPARVTPEDADGQLPTGGGGKRGPWCGCDLAEPGQYVSCGTNARGTHTAREGAGQRASMPNMDGTQIIQVLTDVVSPLLSRRRATPTAARMQSLPLPHPQTTSLPRFLASPSANINRPKQLFRYAAGSADLLLSVVLATVRSPRCRGRSAHGVSLRCRLWASASCRRTPPGVGDSVRDSCASETS